MAAKPTVNNLSNSEDILYFYNNALAYRRIGIENRKSIINIANKYGIAIKFLNYGECKFFKPSPNVIAIYDSKEAGVNKIFFNHLRNAFAHRGIVIEDGRCTMTDWNAFENGKKCKYKVGRITMKGDVDYNSFKSTLDEFYDEQSKKKKSTDNSKSKKQDK